MKKYIHFISVLLFSGNLTAQKVTVITTHDNVSFRGLSIVKNCIWVSGNYGTIGKSTDNGNTWQWFTVKEYENIDFRDIESFDARTAIIMGIASPAYILKTTDGGINWKKVYENTAPDIFLDAMAFKDQKQGMVIGDPINGQLFVAKTSNGGNTWQKTNELHLPSSYNGEAFFAASGSNIIWNKPTYYIVSGGMISRIFSRGKFQVLPTTQGYTMTGANSIAKQHKTILIASGDYEHQSKNDSAFVYSNDDGKTWKLPVTMPAGYRSCVCFAGKDTAITCGITGVDVSYDSGKTWENISTESFNTCAYNKVENAVYFVGNNGRLGKLIL